MEPAGSKRERPGGREVEAASWGICSVWEQRRSGSRQETALEPCGSVAPSCACSDSVAVGGGQDPRCGGGGEGREGSHGPHHMATEPAAPWVPSGAHQGCPPGFALLPLSVCVLGTSLRKGGGWETSP